MSALQEFVCADELVCNGGWKKQRASNAQEREISTDGPILLSAARL